MAFEYHLKSMGSYDTIKSKIEKKTWGKPRATKKRKKCVKTGKLEMLKKAIGANHLRPSKGKESSKPLNLCLHSTGLTYPLQTRTSEFR